MKSCLDKISNIGLTSSLDGINILSTFSSSKITSFILQAEEICRWPQNDFRWRSSRCQMKWKLCGRQNLLEVICVSNVLHVFPLGLELTGDFQETCSSSSVGKTSKRTNYPTVIWNKLFNTLRISYFSVTKLTGYFCFCRWDNLILYCQQHYMAVNKINYVQGKYIKNKHNILKYKDVYFIPLFLRLLSWLYRS